MTENRLMLMRLLIGLGLSERFTKTVARTLKSEIDVNKMLYFLAENRPNEEEPIVTELIRIRGYRE